MAEQSPRTLRTLLNPSFLVAVLVLGGAAFGVSPYVARVAGTAVKEPVPLRKPLSELDRNRLGPYIFHQANAFNKAVEDALGTDQYIDWMFEDTSVKEKNSPRRWVRLLVTYYTGGRDPVPHVGEECLLGAGYQPVEYGDVDLTVAALQQSIPTRALTVRKTAILGEEELTVLYTFHSNGDFAGSRDAVRYRINSLRGKYSYYCKIELSFGSPSARPATATRQETIEAAGKFLDICLPVLLEEHLPDWKAVEARSAAAS